MVSSRGGFANPVIPIHGGVRLMLHIQPRAARTELAGRYGDALKVRIKSPPIDGLANEELLRFLGDLFGVPSGSIELVSGHAARRKSVRVQGVSMEEAERLLGLARS
jgi:uncharacterized protein (TIGR00251 family)